MQTKRIIGLLWRRITGPPIALKPIKEEIIKILSQEAIALHQLKLSLPKYSVDQIAAAIEQLEERQIIKRNTLDQYIKL